MVESSSPALPNRRVLLVDDNEELHRDLRLALAPGRRGGRADELAERIFGIAAEPERAPEYEIDSAFQGAEALERVAAALAQERPYALAVVDMRMPPGWDGLETIERLFSADAEIQVVLCTAFSDHGWDQIRARLGATDRLLILKKPVEDVEVRQLASALTEKWNLARAGREAEGRLDELAAQTEMILTSAVEGILCLEPSGAVSYANPAALEIIGREGAALRGSDPHALLHASGSCAAPCALAEALRGDRPWRSREARLHLAEEVERLVECVYTPVRGATGARGGAVLAFRDITEERALEAQLLRARKLESIESLAGGVAHEINTPVQYASDGLRFLGEALATLSRLAGLGQELAASVEEGADARALAGELDALGKSLDLAFLIENAPGALRRSRDGIGRIAEIVRAMNEFSHPGADEPEPVDANRVVETALTVSRGQWKHVAEVELDLAPGLGPVSGHAGALSQVLVNLIVNACHAIEKAREADPGRPGRIRIRSAERGEAVELSVEDDGCGIPRALRERIFDPFFTTKGVGRGTGQGLAIAHSIVVKKHAGTIRCESEEGCGTRFVLRLPRDRAGDPPAREERADPANEDGRRI